MKSYELRGGPSRFNGPPPKHKSMKTNPAKALFQQVGQILLDPISNGPSGIPPICRFQIDFEGYKGITDLIGGTLFPANDPDGEPIESDLAEQALKLPAVDTDDRITTVGILLDEAIAAHLAQRPPTGTTTKEPTAPSTFASPHASASPAKSPSDS